MMMTTQTQTRVQIGLQIALIDKEKSELAKNTIPCLDRTFNPSHTVMGRSGDLEGEDKEDP